MSITEAAAVPQLTPQKSPWNVPCGFSTYELTQTLQGPILGGDGQPVDYGPRVYHWGLQHIYDDGTVRIAIRPGNRETYSAAGYYMSIESLAGKPGQQFSDVHAALAAAAAELRKWPYYREALAGGATNRHPQGEFRWPLHERRDRALVTHPDRQDHGTVVDSSGPAWTPNELTTEPPDAGMVKVRWSNSADATQLYWEYAAELQPAEMR